MGVSAIILAAGESRRMGTENKLLLEVNGKPILRHVVDAVVASTALECIVVTGHEGEAVKAILEDVNVSLVENPDYAAGMGTSIRAGVLAARVEAAGYMICLSDMPAIETGEYDALLAAFNNQYFFDPGAIVVPRHAGRRGNPVLLSARYKPQILAHRGVDGCRSIVNANPDHVLFYDMPTDHVLLDVDTPEALQAYKSR